MYQSLRTVLNVKDSYETIRERLSDYEKLMRDFNEKIIQRKRIELADTVLIGIQARAIRNIADEGEHLYKSFTDLVLYATGAAACSTADLLVVLDAINLSLDNIQSHFNRSYLTHGDMCKSVSVIGRRKCTGVRVLRKWRMMPSPVGG